MPKHLADLTQSEGPLNLGPYAKRIKFLREAEQAHEILSSALLELETNLPSERLAMVERL
jgi:hypothetical protein